MTEKVLAAVQVGDRQLELQEFPRPEIGPDAGLLRVETCGICGTDVEQYQGALHGTNLPHRYPMVPGHEPVGIIEELGENAARRWGVRVGDCVAVEAFIPCGHCRACLSGRYTACNGWGPAFLAYSAVSTNVPPALWGGFAQRMYLHPNTLLHKIPEQVPLELAALFNPLAAGVRWAVSVPDTQMGDTLVILGPGQRGLACVVAARTAGAGTIIVTGLSADHHKLALARDLGADFTIDVEREDVVARVRELTAGQLADVVVDVSAFATQPVLDALDVVRPGGTIVLAGLKGNKVVPGFISDKVVTKSITLKGSLGVDYPAYEQAIRIIAAGRFPLERLVTHRFGLEDLDRAIRILGREIPGEDAISILIRP